MIKKRNNGTRTELSMRRLAGLGRITTVFSTVFFLIRPSFERIFHLKDILIALR